MLAHLAVLIFPLMLNTNFLGDFENHLTFIRIITLSFISFILHSNILSLNKDIQRQQYSYFCDCHQRPLNIYSTGWVPFRAIFCYTILSLPSAGLSAKIQPSQPQIETFDRFDRRRRPLNATSLPRKKMTSTPCYVIRKGIERLLCREKGLSEY